MDGSFVCLPSGVMTTAWTRAPFGIRTVSMDATLPDTPEWMSALTKPPAFPTTVPTKTSSPFLTHGVQGAPMCCCMGRTIFSGSGSCRVA